MKSAPFYVILALLNLWVAVINIMDKSLSGAKSYRANKIINAETVKYTAAAVFSFFILIAVKQLFKNFFNVSTAVSCIIAYIIAAVVLFVSERYFVFKKGAKNSLPAQIGIGILSTAVYFVIYEAIYIICCDELLMYDFSAWFIAFIIIAVINYFVAKLFIFNSNIPPEQCSGGRAYGLFYKNRYVAVAMVTAFIALLFIYAVYSVFPFGDTTVLRMDLYHQYGPLFEELYERVISGGSFLYSWTSGGGTSFLGNFFNYLSSPLTIFIFLFDKEQMPYAITFLVMLKCVLSAGAFTYYLRKSRGSHSLATAALGLLYAFSAYFLAYFWNIMWLDAMIMLPFIALGIERIINKGKCGVYTVSLVIMFFSNYYMGYMLCIFSVIYFIAYFIISGKRAFARRALPKKPLKTRIKESALICSGTKFVGCSLLAAALTAFALIPVFCILTGSSATSDSFPETTYSYFSAFDFIETHFAALETTIRSSGDDVLPNIYCGIITLIALPLFIINKDIRLRDKIVYTALLIIFFISFDSNVINFIWHAFHFPNDLPYRFSYMYSFILLIMAAEVIKHLKALSLKDIGLVSLAWIGIVAISQELPTEKMTDKTVWVSLAFIIVWAGVLFIVRGKKLKGVTASFMILAAAFCEVLVADTAAFDFNQGYSDYTENLDTYTEAVDYIKDSDDSFYRAELCSLNTRMDPCLYNYNGMSIFSSMAYEAYSRAQYSLGMYGNRINSYTYNTQTPVYNMMYSIKYLIYNGEESRPSTSLYTRCYETGDGSVVYENDYFMPIAFCADEAILGWSAEEGDPFDVQGDFFTRASGYSGVFNEAEFTRCIYTDAVGDEVTGNGEYWFTPDDENGATAEITAEAQNDGNMYIYVTSYDVTSLYADTPQGTIYQDLDTPYILDLGYFEAGEQAIITLNCETAETGSFGIYTYTIDSDVFEEGYEKLNAGAIEISNYSDRKIEGTVNADEDSILYTSIPYDSGWSVYVDGEKAETIEIGACQLGIRLNEGEHNVKFSFIPTGLEAGIAVSAVTLAGVCAGAVITHVRRRKRQNSEEIKTN